MQEHKSSISVLPICERLKIETPDGAPFDISSIPSRFSFNVFGKDSSHFKCEIRIQGFPARTHMQLRTPA